jgi:acetyl-CoA carboxylase biotin carboxyl carrier protein
MTSAIKFDPEAIRALAQILRDTDLTEIELVEKDSRIRVARAPAPVLAAAPAAAPAAAVPPGGVEVASASAAAAAGSAPPPREASHPGTVSSPMVGIAYLSPEPGAEPFVAVGTRVAQGQTLLLIEAMKTFNQIRSPRAGTVTRILIENGTPVEYGEPLMVVE